MNPRAGPHPEEALRPPEVETSPRARPLSGALNFGNGPSLLVRFLGLLAPSPGSHPGRRGRAPVPDTSPDLLREGRRFGPFRRSGVAPRRGGWRGSRPPRFGAPGPGPKHGCLRPEGAVGLLSGSRKRGSVPGTLRARKRLSPSSPAPRAGSAPRPHVAASEAGPRQRSAPAARRGQGPRGARPPESPPRP